MNLTLSDDQQRFRASVRRFVEAEVRPVAQAIDEAGEFPRALFEKCGAGGYFALRYPPEDGGAGADFLTYCLMMEELAAGSMSLAAAVAMQSLMGTAMIHRNGTREQKRRLLAPALRGELIGAIAMTEPDFGSDLGGMRTRARRTDDGWVITGQKTWITSATVADFFTVAAKTDPEAGFRGIDLFLVERGAPGLTVGRRIDKLGVRAAETSEVAFDGVAVAADAILGAPGTGSAALGSMLNEIRIMTGALGLGLGRAALEAAAAYANERHQFRRPIGAFQAVAHRVADMATRLEAARGLVWQAAWQLDQGLGDVKLAAMAKLFATEAANEIADGCTRIHGSYGFAMDYDAQRYLRDARFLLYGGGTSEILRTVIARQMGVPRKP
ncbi:MAG: acyl-CoA dehydrogenase family protein [Anaerolineae bacterium]